jgi:hypothetical protein
VPALSDLRYDSCPDTYYYVTQLCRFVRTSNKEKTEKTPWSESASELYRPSDRRLSAKLVPTFCVKDLYGRILGFEERHHVSATKPNRLMLFKETVAVYCENHAEHTDTLRGQNAEF